MSSSENKPQRVLFLALSGIGNLLMQLPTINALKKAHPDWSVSVWVAPRGTKPLAEASPAVDTVIQAKIKRSLTGHIYQTYKLAAKKPDIAIMLSPGQLLKGAAYMFLSGADRRVAHRYPHLGNPASPFLLSDSIPEEPATHDVDQNLHLLEPLGISVIDLLGQPYHFTVPAANVASGKTLFQSLHLPTDKKIIGLHAGSAPDFLWKRWPLEHFAHVAKALIANHQSHILLFGGPDEKAQNRDLQKMIGAAHTSLISTSLLTTAAVIKQCHLFVANDSGLMHIAAAVGVPTFGIFGPTDENATGPRGVKSWAIRAPHTEAVYHTEQHYDVGSQPHATLLKVTPTMVLERLAAHL